MARKALKEKQEKNKQLCGNSYNQDYLEYICVDDGGNIIRPDYVTETFLKLLKKKKLKQIRFHDLRHTCASLLINSGVDPKTVSKRLGHSDTSITMEIYTHAFEESKNACADRFDEMMKKLEMA